MLWKGSSTFRAHFSKRSCRHVIFGIVLFIACIGGVYALSDTAVLAQTREAVTNVETVTRQAGVRTTSIYVIIGRVIYAFLSLVGLVLLGYMLYAGYLWTTAGENTENVERARKMIQNAIIGLLIIAASFAITSFVISRLSDVVSGGGSESESTSPISFPSAAGALGNGIIEYHLPERDATGVPRNTSIIMTFKEPLRIASLVQGYDDAGTPEDPTDDRPTTALNAGTMRIIKLGGGREEILTSEQADVRFTEDRKTFVVKPREWLGSPSVNTNYRIELMPGRAGLLLQDGSPAFGPAHPSGYRWQFEVSTLVDLTPPRILSIVPVRGVQPPNVVVQINFDEAIDPTSAAGVFRVARGFSNIEMTAAPLTPPGSPTSRVEGEFKVSNRYQTVEFMSDDICGRNACGRDIRCLPRVSTIGLLVKSAQLSAEPPQARVVTAGGGGSLFDGVVDVASNALDGNNNGRAEGPTLDSARITFGTSAEPVLTPPRIGSTNPTFGVTDYPTGSSNVPADHQPQATFGIGADDVLANVLQGSTVNSTNIYMTTQNEPPESATDTFWFNTYQVILSAGGIPVTTEDPAFGRVHINHRRYARLPVAAPPGTFPPVYAPILTSGVQNLLQNCFKPSASITCPATLGSPSVPGNPNCCDNRAQAGACSFSRRTP